MYRYRWCRASLGLLAKRILRPNPLAQHWGGVRTVPLCSCVAHLSWRCLLYLFIYTLGPKEFYKRPKEFLKPHPSFGLSVFFLSFFLEPPFSHSTQRQKNWEAGAPKEFAQKGDMACP